MENQNMMNEEYIVALDENNNTHKWVIEQDKHPLMYSVSLSTDRTIVTNFDKKKVIPMFDELYYTENVNLKNSLDREFEDLATSELGTLIKVR